MELLTCAFQDISGSSWMLYELILFGLLIELQVSFLFPHSPLERRSLDLKMLRFLLLPSPTPFSVLVTVYHLQLITGFASTACGDPFLSFCQKLNLICYKCVHAHMYVFLLASWGRAMNGEMPFQAHTTTREHCVLKLMTTCFC